MRTVPILRADLHSKDLHRKINVKVALHALLISRWERAGVRETIIVPTTDIFRDGVGAVIVRGDYHPGRFLRRS